VKAGETAQEQRCGRIGETAANLGPITVFHADGQLRTGQLGRVGVLMV
jgi:hypothetical protein